MLQDYTGEIFTLSEADTRAVKRARKALSRVEVATMPPYLHFTELPEAVAIPKAAIPLLVHLLDAFSNSQSVLLMAEESELTPRQAAAMLGISRPMLMHIVKQDIIPHRRVGSHYRLNLQDVLEYQQKKQRRGILLDQLTTEAQELNMGY